MISGTRNLLWIIPLFLLLTSPFWKGPFARFLIPGADRQIEASSTAVRDRSISLNSVTLSRFDNGLLEMLLTAERVQSERSGMNLLYLEGVDLLLFGQGEKKAHITGGEGSYDTTHNIITMVEDVAVKTSDNLELSTDALRYLITYKTMKTASEIFFTSRRATVRGTGMMYDFESGEYRVGGRVIGDMK
ncbi:MAG: LPS export ABC transporter periplasmic protein LptC [Desulfobulbaceae bacterium DB1]|nr:MAG: LPS export ABC transporter periplasmic protein LptC [Desulfobulbaceae bacterium DB1]